ncbi:MAG: ABC transporter ATP-binding protein [Proteobacteria bacterium]|jgi:iron complex transport system ATP-binding protein|nr:ABC transporter ATP-binding protein [Pseudomonadota bacterium]MDA1290663.1 ABC transporter ATP-binding protein [Pseudomonadota bacterium]
MANLKIQSLSLHIEGKTLCHDLNVQVGENERWGLLGKNGAGKTTLLHALIGQRRADQGSIELDGISVYDIKQRELASKVGILFQQGIEALPATVFETVMLGRHPHAQSLLWDDPQDIEIAKSALAAFDLDQLQERAVESLSGGELQRLALAMLLAQTPQLFLLDEPSNHLDVAFQVKLLSVLTNKVVETSASLIMATHDINLAFRFCENVILLLADGESIVGSCTDVLTEEHLSRAYGCHIKSVSSGEHRLFYPA